MKNIFHNFFLYIKMVNKDYQKRKFSEKKHAKDTKIFLKKRKIKHKSRDKYENLPKEKKAKTT